MRFYKDLPLPFEEQSPPTSEMCFDWNCEQLLAFMGTYSTRPRYAELHKKDPLDLIRDELIEAWGDPQEVKKVRFPLGFRVGK